MLAYGLNITKIEDLKILRRVVEMNNEEKPNFTKLARELGMHRDTVRKYYNGYVPSKNRNKISKIDKHKDVIKDLLDNEYKNFDYMNHLYRYLKREFPGEVNYSESAFRRYIKKNLKSEFKNSKSKKSIRFETEPGYQIQFDYKENQNYIDVNGCKMKTDIATIVFGHSRYIFRSVIADKTTESLVTFLAKTFDSIGGVPKQIVVDNGSSMVSKPRSKDFEGEINYKLKQFLDDYGIEAYICMPGSPETKGKVEVQMKVTDELKCYGGEIKDYVHLDDILQTITDDQNYRVSQAIHVAPIVLWQKEKEHLNPLPNKSICSSYYSQLPSAIANKESLVSYKSNLYSVPPKYIGLQIARQTINNKLHFYYNEKFLCSHEITNQKINYHDAHREELCKILYKKETKIEENLAQLDANVKVLREIKYD